jgi:hypothetical protein
VKEASSSHVDDANLLACLEHLGVQLDLAGSGLDSSWFGRAFANVELESEFLADGLLIRLFREGGLESARRFMARATPPACGSRFAETWYLLEEHARLADRMTLA